MRTILVSRFASSLVGQVTFLSSATTSAIYLRIRENTDPPAVACPLILAHLSIDLVGATAGAVPPQLQPLRVVPFVLAGGICPFLALGTGEMNYNPGSSLLSQSKLPYSKVLVITPAPTVRPPSLTANLSPSSMATGSMSFTFILILSPGITISTPWGSSMLPVTSVVLMKN